MNVPGDDPRLVPQGGVAPADAGELLVVLVDGVGNAVGVDCVSYDNVGEAAVGIAVGIAVVVAVRVAVGMAVGMVVVLSRPLLLRNSSMVSPATPFWASRARRQRFSAATARAADCMSRLAWMPWFS